MTTKTEQIKTMKRQTYRNNELLAKIRVVFNDGTYKRARLLVENGNEDITLPDWSFLDMHPRQVENLNDLFSLSAGHYDIYAKYPGLKVLTK